MSKECIKYFMKNCILWRLRYYIKLQEAKGKIKLSNAIKQHSTIEKYNTELYEVLQAFHIDDFKGKTVCEMGPGQFLSHAFLEYQLGADKEILLEIADYAGIDNPADLSKLALSNHYEAVRELPALDLNEKWGVSAENQRVIQYQRA